MNKKHLTGSCFSGVTLARHLILIKLISENIVLRESKLKESQIQNFQIKYQNFIAMNVLLIIGIFSFLTPGR